MGTKQTTRRRATVSDDGAQARIRRIFRDAENAALEQLGTSGMGGGEPDDDDDGGEADGSGNHTHIHIHGSEGGPAPKPAVDDGDGDDPANPLPNNDRQPGQTQDDPVEARFQQIEATLAKILQKLGGDGSSAAPPTGDEMPIDDPTVTKKSELTSAAPEELTHDDGLPEEIETAKKAKTGDSVALETSFKMVLADAEVLVPGFRVPTFDSKAKRRVTMDSMCALRRSVLSHLSMSADGTQLLTAAAGRDPGDLSKLTCASAAMMFRAAAGAKRAVNNATSTRDAQRTPSGFGTAKPVQGKIKTLADLNKLHRELADKHRA